MGRVVLGPGFGIPDFQSGSRDFPYLSSWSELGNFLLIELSLKICHFPARSWNPRLWAWSPWALMWPAGLTVIISPSNFKWCSSLIKVWWGTCYCQARWPHQSSRTPNPESRISGLGQEKISNASSLRTWSNPDQLDKYGKCEFPEPKSGILRPSLCPLRHYVSTLNYIWALSKIRPAGRISDSCFRPRIQIPGQDILKSLYLVGLVRPSHSPELFRMNLVGLAGPSHSFETFVL